MNPLLNLFQSSGLVHFELGQFVMILVGIGLLYLAINRQYEPLLLLPIGFACVLANIPGGGLAFSAVENALASQDAEFINSLGALLDLGYVPDNNSIVESLKSDPLIFAFANELAVRAGYSHGVLYSFYEVTIASGVAPLVIFMGVGAMTDFGPLLANPRTLILGAAAQFGIFATVLGAIALNHIGVTDFTLAQSAAIGIIGGADGPTAIYIANILAPDLLGAIAVAAYSYMALVPLIQPPIMRALTSQAERCIVMTQLRPVSQKEKITFPVLLVLLIAILLPASAPLVGMFCFGNLMRESGVVDRLSETAQNSLINITTIFLGLSVGSKLVADQFLQFNTLGILLLGVVAFGIGTASGVLMAKIINYYSDTPLNPLIGAAGVSAVPMAARVSNRVGLESNHENFLLMHAMGPNVAGVIGSAIAAGVMISLLG